MKLEKPVSIFTILMKETSTKANKSLLKRSINVRRTSHSSTCDVSGQIYPSRKEKRWALRASFKIILPGKIPADHNRLATNETVPVARAILLRFHARRNPFPNAVRNPLQDDDQCGRISHLIRSHYTSTAPTAVLWMVRS